MRRKNRKLALQVETLAALTAPQLRQAHGATVVAIDPHPISDPRQSCLCMTTPETECLCPEEAPTLVGVG